MLPEERRKGPAWAWRVSGLIVENLAAVLLVGAAVAVGVVVFGSSAGLAGVCDPRAVPVESRGAVLSAVAVGAYGLGVGLGFAVGRA